MDTQGNFIEELEIAIASKSMSQRADALRRVTDLFVLGTGSFSDQQLELFGDVMSKLVMDIELTVRASFGSRLAKLSDAPRTVIRFLALDDQIEVAGQVLRNSPQLDEQTLVECSRTLSQGHLLAISGRTTLSEPVTDVLIDRGEVAVLHSLVKNQSARFSDDGATTLVKKTAMDGHIALALWSRPDIPRHATVKLFVEASSAVRKRLEAADPRKSEQIKMAVGNATETIQATARMGSQEHAEALAEVQALNAAGKLNNARLSNFAAQGHFDKIAVALALMCHLPVGLVERILVDRQQEQLLVLAKSIDLPWMAVKSILSVAANGPIERNLLEHLFKSYNKLQVTTAQTALQFFRLRERAIAG